MSNRKLGKVYSGAFIVAGAIGLAGCEGATDRAVSYAEDVQPILAEHCIECHRPGAEGYAKSGFGVESYAATMKGTKFGPVVIGGDSIGSTLVVLIEGRAHSSIQMPHGQQRMPEEQIETVKRWVDQGAMDN
ncbi:MAG: hypothetical protein P8Y61_09830 [Gammaproteobacteria bacterium]|jgi:mono/diheme cytochrome c family protein